MSRSFVAFDIPPIVSLFAALLAAASTHADEAIPDDAEIGALFKQHDITGTLVIASLDGKIEHIWNSKRADERFMPASTFKIPNALILLEEKALRDSKESIAWDGKDNGWKEWNRDHNLETAYRFSCVWFYQKAAARLSLETYQTNLKKLAYGNENVLTDFTSFWLNNSLKISAREQVAFLGRLHEETLPFKKQTIAAVKDIMIEEKTNEYVLRAKTGWGRADGMADVGWWVGYVEKRDEVWLFAMNLVIAEPKQKVHRQNITKAALRAKGILPPSE